MVALDNVVVLSEVEGTMVNEEVSDEVEEVSEV